MAVRRPRRVFGQLGRGMLSVGGMYTNFSALTRLPLADATAISFASPLITVALAAIILKERVRIYRWTAVLVGFVGVIVMLIPHFDANHYAAAGAAAAATIGSLLALVSAFCNAGTVIQTRRLTQSETTSSIVFYFSLMTALAGLVSLPFAWHTPTSFSELAMLVSMGVFGGIGHIFLTESYRYAPASVIAPFDYSSMLWALLLGYWLFGELPTVLVYVGAGIVTAAGLFVIWRERQLGLEAQARRGGRAAGAGRDRGRKALDYLECLEGDGRPGIADAVDAVHLLVDEVADVGAGLDVEFHQQVEIAGGRIDLGGDLSFGKFVGDLIGLAEFAFDLDEERGHCRSLQSFSWRMILSENRHRTGIMRNAAKSRFRSCKTALAKSRLAFAGTRGLGI